MYDIKDIISRSASTDEIVVSYADAMELLQIKNIRILGWEGWIKRQDGTVGHSIRYQGTSDLSNLPDSSALHLVKTSITQAQSEWREKPEIENAELLFCIGIVQY